MSKFFHKPPDKTPWVTCRGIQTINGKQYPVQYIVPKGHSFPFCIEVHGSYEQLEQLCKLMNEAKCEVHNVRSEDTSKYVVEMFSKKQEEKPKPYKPGGFLSK